MSYSVIVEGNNLLVNTTTNDISLSLSRTGGQGSRGDSVSNVYIDGNNDFIVEISNSANVVVSTINLGGSNEISLLYDFQGKYVGVSASEPTLDGQGNPLLSGALYFNTTTDQIGVYDGVVWGYPALDASNSASAASTSETNAATSAANALTSENAAAGSASSASTSEVNASTSASAASSSASAASTSAGQASTSETNAAISATNAGASATAASASEVSAATSESNASGFATSASNSASAASISETNAANSASGAATSETNAATSAAASLTSANNAATSETNAAASYDAFDDRYLGSKASDPTLDNDGDAILTGALYWNTTSSALKIYDGAAWNVAAFDASGALVAANNLSDLTNAATARTNLGLGTDDLPAIFPTLNLDFANAQSITSKTTYTRASTATYYDANGTLQTAAVDAPRFDHDPVTGERLGILLEEQRTNLVTYSEQFDNVDWAKGSSTVTANAVTAPDGTTTADKLVEVSSTGEHLLRISCSFGAGEYTASIYVKAAERSGILLRPVHIGANEGATSETTVDLIAGTVSTPAGGGTSSTITDVGGGWYRVSLTLAVTGTLTTTQFGVQLADGGGNSIYTGDGTSGIYIWGAQLEVGSFPTSYIKTEASQVTRSADDLSITGTNFSDFYNQTEGTFVMDLDYSGGSPAPPVLFSAGTSFSDTFYISQPSANLGLTLIEGGVSQYSGAGIAAPSDQFKLAIALKQDDMAFVIDGGTVSTDTSGTIPTVTNLTLARASWTAGNYACTHIKSLTYYPRRLTNAQLQSLTTA